MGEAIDQLWYTSSYVGLGTTGIQVRAASAGLRNLNSIRYHTIQSHLIYKLPQGAPATTADSSGTPVCLLWNYPGTERVLAHKRFVGRTWDNRPGNYFTHLLAGLPNDMTARDAIELWAAPFWALTDSLETSQTTLPQLTRDDLVPGPLTYAALQQIDTAVLAFVIQAFLTLAPQERLYIAAEAESVAIMIWGLTHCLPSRLLQPITFSTYERDVSSTSLPMIVGTCYIKSPEAPDLQERILPPTCYGPHNKAINCYTGQTSSLTPDETLSAFTQFAVQALQRGETAELDGLLQIAERLEVADAAALLLIYRFYTAGASDQDPSPVDLSRLLATPAVAAELIQRQGIQEALVRLMLAKPAWWQSTGKPGIQALKAYVNQPTAGPVATALSAIETQLISQVERAIRADDLETGRLILDDYLPSISHAGMRPVWDRLLSQLRAAPPLPWHTRRWLLMCLVQIYSEEVEPIHFLLDSTLDEIEALLSIELPGRWKKAALYQGLSGNRLNTLTPAQMTRFAQAHPDDVSITLVAMVAQPGGWQQALHLYTLLLQGNYSSYLELLRVLVLNAPRSVDLIGRMLEIHSAQDGNPVHEGAWKLILEQGYDQLLASNNAEVTSLINWYLERLTLADLQRPAALRTLDQLRRLDWLGEKPQQRAAAWSTIQKFLHQPMLDYKSLSALRQRIDSLPQAHQFDVYQELTPVLVTNTSSADQLSRLRETLGRDPATWKNLFSRMLSYALEEVRLHGAAAALAPFVEYMLDANRSMSPQDSDRLDLALQQASRGTFDTIDRYAAKWPVRTRNHWEAYKANYRPTKPSERITQLARHAINGVRKRLSLLLSLLIGLTGIMMVAVIWMAAIPHRWDTQPTGAAPASMASPGLASSGSGESAATSALPSLTPAASSATSVSSAGASSQSTAVAPYEPNQRIAVEEYQDAYDTDSTNEGDVSGPVGDARNVKARQLQAKSVDIGICTDTSLCSFYIGWIKADEWLRYSVNVNRQGLYEFRFLVATLEDRPTFLVKIDGEERCQTITNLPKGGWQTWSEVKSAPIALRQGHHTLTLIAVEGGFNLGSIMLQELDSEPQPGAEVPPQSPCPKLMTSPPEGPAR